MILLNEIAKKIEDILNGTDAEVINLNIERPVGFYFKVATEGFHLDGIADMEEGQNFIPVFVSSMGGNFNPVPDLMQANYVIPIAIYFPVRFKNEMYRINEYLARVFVGRYLTYGTESGKALSNISVAQFGEITDLDLKQFVEWEETTYKKKIEVMEPYLQMTINLFLNTASGTYVFGNSVTAGLSFTENETTYSDSNLSFVGASTQNNVDLAVQQLIGTDEVSGLPNSTSYGTSLTVYIKNTAFYEKLLQHYANGTTQNISMTLTLTILGVAITRTVFTQSINISIQKGELMTITLSFFKKIIL